MEATTHQPVETAPVRRGWWRRNWKRLILGTVLLVLVAAIGGYFVKFGPVLFSEPYQLALIAVERSPQVIAELGEPIKRRAWLDWTPSGMIEQNGQIDKARLTFSVSGPKGSANVSALVQRTEGQWGFAQFEVALLFDGRSEGKHLNLISEVNAGKPDDVKKFDPTQQQPKTITTEEAPADLNIKIPDIESPPSGK